jgi:DNA-dependent RNA polymerase auxiliary subunit epsilon
MDNTDADNISAPYLDLHLEIDSEVRLRTKLYDKREDFNFPFVNL